MKMVIHEGGWELQLDKCRADEHFVHLAFSEMWKDLDIFHMGPGMHHLIGQNLGYDNRIWAITNSFEEAESYNNLVYENPELSKKYKVFFGDIYCIDYRMFPLFDVVNLPHFGEMPDTRRFEYSKLDDAILAVVLKNMLKQRGRLIGYKGSSAWDRTEPIFSCLGLTLEHDYESLRIWKKD